MDLTKKNTPEARLDKAGAEFKRLEAKIERLELKIVLLNDKFDSMQGELVRRYELIAEVCKGLLNIVNKELGELTNKKEN